jgi:hypothetical protein
VFHQKIWLSYRKPTGNLGVKERDIYHDLHPVAFELPGWGKNFFCPSRAGRKPRPLTTIGQVSILVTWIHECGKFYQGQLKHDLNHRILLQPNP